MMMSVIASPANGGTKQSFKRSPRPLRGLPGPPIWPKARAGAMTLTLLACFSGCSLLDHIDEIMTLGDYARDKEVQEKIVNSIDTHYDALLTAIKSGKIKKYSNQKEILQVFGEPILIKRIETPGQHQEQWLYRHGLPMKAKDKVYLYFDAKGKLLQYEQGSIPW